MSIFCPLFINDKQPFCGDYRKEKHTIEKVLLRDIWRNPRSVSELLVSLVIYINDTKLGRVLFFAPKLLAMAVFVFLPLYPAERSIEKNDDYSARHSLKLFFICFAITLFFCYGMITALTYLDGRLFSVAESVQTGLFGIYNFNDDWANILLYSIVVPSYVALGFVVVSVSRSFQNQQSFRGGESLRPSQKVIDGTRPEFLRGGWQTNVIIVAILFVSFWISAGYQNDVYNLLLCLKDDSSNGACSPLLYWFLAEKTYGVSYNTAGLYYILLNYSLMVVIIFCVLFFYSSAFSVAGLIKHINNGLYDDVGVLYQDLRIYKYLFVYAKWLFLAFIINTHIWKASHLGDVQNLDITIIVYGIIGSMILPIPNYIVQTSWNLRQRKLFLDGAITERAQSCSIFTRGWLTVVKNAANFFITLFFAVSVVGVISDALGIESDFSLIESFKHLLGN